MDTLNAIHSKMIRVVTHAGGRIDAVFFCPHTDEDKCNCRKPKTGLLEDIAARFHCDLNGVPAIGDSLRDLQAAVAVGALPLLVLTGKGAKAQLDPKLPAGTLIFVDLAAAVESLTP
jgi:D-glycero-D-manno-heptose 1,7-bisphosphate phosphatase